MINYILAIDYDGTLFKGNCFVIGEPICSVLQQVKRFCDHPHCEVILWTCREEKYLAEAVERCEAFGLKFAAVNTNSAMALQWEVEKFGRHGLCNGRKIYANLYVDDKSPGSIAHFLTLDPETELKKLNAKEDL
jgi:hypothetical protein